MTTFLDFERDSTLAPTNFMRFAVLLPVRTVGVMGDEQ